jgi:MFS family permease
MMTRRTAVAVASLVLSLALMAAAFALASNIYWLTFLPLTLVGVVLAWRRPENPIGWLLSSFGLLGALNTFAQAYATRGLTIAPGSLPGADVAMWFQSWEWAVYVGILSTAFLLFPSGHLPSPRWRLPLAAIWVVVAVICVSIAFFSSPPEEQVSYRNPFAVAILWDYPPFLPLMYVAPSIGALSLVARARRARGDERQQLKLVGFAVAVFAVMVLGYALQALGLQLLDQGVGNLIFYVATAGLPLSIGIAILRYRLYDIDLIISRTLVYGALTAILAAAYVGAIAVLQVVLQPFTQGSELAVAASTLVVAALFQPLRARIQRAVDRRFNRRKYDAAKTLEAFGARLRSQVDLEALRAEVVGAAQETVQPRLASLWLLERPGRR